MSAPTPGSGKNEVRFKRHDGSTLVFRASRPGVLVVLKRAMENYDCFSVEFEGTAEQLLAADVVTPEMLNLPPSGARSGGDEFGDRFTVKRRAGGRYEVERWFYEGGPPGNRGPGRGWKALGPSVCDEVEAILRRMRLARGEVQP